MGMEKVVACRPAPQVKMTGNTGMYKLKQKHQLTTTLVEIRQVHSECAIAACPTASLWAVWGAGTIINLNLTFLSAAYSGPYTINFPLALMFWLF